MNRPPFPPPEPPARRWRNRTLLGMVFLVLVFTVTLIVLIPDQGDVSRAGFSRIRQGMSEVDIIAVLGQPDRSHVILVMRDPQTRAIQHHVVAGGSTIATLQSQGYEPVRQLTWFNSRVTITIDLDQSGAIAQTALGEGRPHAAIVKVIDRFEDLFERLLD